MDAVESDATQYCRLAASQPVSALTDDNIVQILQLWVVIYFPDQNFSKNKKSEDFWIVKEYQEFFKNFRDGVIDDYLVLYQLL